MTPGVNDDPRDALPADQLLPQVDLPRGGLPGWALAAIMGVVALALFLYLDSMRVNRLENGAERTGKPLNLPAPPPALTIPAPPPAAPATPAAADNRPALPAPAPFPTYTPPPIQFRSAMQRQVTPDVYAPPRYRTDTPTAAPPTGSSGNALVVDLTAGKGAAVNGAGGAAGGDAAAQNGDFGDEAVRATVIRNRAVVVPQGVIIAAVLETPLNSDRPGLARALVSGDVRSFDGTNVLIPRGSRLVGEFKADTSPGKRRILVTWNRLIRPDGVAIRIGSPSSDAMGGAGIPGRVNTHFLERFASAVLQSALTIGVNVASQIPNNGSNIYVGLPGQAQQLGQELVPNTNRPPTVKVKAGAEIAIFVAHDLDFGGTPAVK